MAVLPTTCWRPASFREPRVSSAGQPGLIGWARTTAEVMYIQHCVRVCPGQSAALDGIWKLALHGLACRSPNPAMEPYITSIPSQA